VTIAYVGLGSNLGDRLGNLRRAVSLLGASGSQVQVLRTSPVYETEPVGGPPQPPFLNAVAEVAVSGDARSLLEACLDVESAMGRVRHERWGPRVIDLDVLLFGEERIDEADLVVPHPRMRERAFVMVPLADLAPESAAASADDAPPATGDVRRFSGPLAGSDRPGAPPAERTAALTVALVGAGRVATALGVLLERGGHRVQTAFGRSAESRERVERNLPSVVFSDDPASAARNADLVVIGVPDDAIAPLVTTLARAGAFRPGQIVAHLSGSTSLGALQAAATTGARVMSLHPLQSFPDVETGLARLPGSGMAVTATNPDDVALGERIAHDVGAVPFVLDDEVKPLYHAGAVFAANYLVTVEAMAEGIMRAAGIADPLPLLRALAATSFDRTFDAGPAAALTGPAVRGDAGTVARNLEALGQRAPEAIEAYVALGRAAARLAAEAGRLDEDAHTRVEEALARWT
jgi:2-amino-4-hydroxy-6-hydroxymethyldihydropteridine diphosphokinase